MAKTERVLERMTMDVPAPILRLPNARRDGHQTAALHEFHLPGQHDQSTHGRRKAAAPSALPDSVPATTPRPRRQRAPRVTPTAQQGKPKLADLVKKQKPSDPATVAAADKIWGGTFAGLTAKVTHATPIHLGSGARANKSLVLQGDITDADGNKVGEFHRTVTAGRGGAKGLAKHQKLEIQAGVRGQGFAEGFNANAIGWYRENGIGSVELHANIDVGGYAWARAGYDWDSDGGGGEHPPLRRLQSVVDNTWPADDNLAGNIVRIPPDRMDEQDEIVQEFADRIKNAKFGTVGYPTPYEVSQLGRWPGAGKDDMWIGKAIMLGSDWYGVRYL